MEAKAIGKFVRVQPRKVRIIADEIRGKAAVHSAALLRYHTSKGARELRKVLVSAVANAMENQNASPDTLKISKITIDEGPRLKRMRARAQGRGNRIVKKTSHITVTVDDTLDLTKIKPHGTKAKPRPTFAAPKKGKAKAKKEETPLVEETVAAAEEAPAAEPAVAEEVKTEAAAEQTAEAPVEPSEESAESAGEAKEEESN